MNDSGRFYTGLGLRPKARSQCATVPLHGSARLSALVEGAPAIVMDQDGFELDTTQTRCIEIDFPGKAMGMRHLLRRNTVAGPISWMGSLVQDNQDASGLMYRRNRFYDPKSGRFTQEDPIGLAGGLNLYGFAAGDPVTYSDPYGMSASAACPPICNELNPQHLELEVARAQNATAGEAVVGGVLMLGASAIVLAPAAIPALAAGAKRLWNRFRGRADDVPDDYIVVRGGTGDVPPPGQTFSGAAGRTLEEAATGVPHGTIRTTTARQIRQSGGTVRHAPEPTRSGAMNDRHVNICRAPGPCPFSEPRPNPIPKAGRVQ